MKVSEMAGALTAAIVGALGALIGGIVANIIPPLTVLVAAFIPYALGASLTPVGIVIAMIYNAIGGFIGAYIVIWIYNALVDVVGKK